MVDLLDTRTDQGEVAKNPDIVPGCLARRNISSENFCQMYRIHKLPVGCPGADRKLPSLTRAGCEPLYPSKMVSCSSETPTASLIVTESLCVALCVVQALGHGVRDDLDEPVHPGV